jgi:superfamily II DNA or RNA helicase
MAGAAPFDAGVQAAAKRLLDANDISDVRVLQNGSVVTGMAGSHRVYIRYRRPAKNFGDFAMDGECSCQERNPCAHLAAVAIMAARQGEAHAADARSTRLDDAPRSARQGLCYVLDEFDGTCRLSVWVARIAPGRREVAGGASLFSRRPTEASDELPRYVNAEDRAILESLPSLGSGPCSLRDHAGFRSLLQIVATGRALWRSPQGHTLIAGAARDAILEWQAAADGAQRLHCVDSDSLHILSGVDPPVFIDAASLECGPLRLPYGVPLLRRYWQQPAIAPDDVPLVNEWLSHQPGADAFPRPREFCVVREARLTLRGHLTLAAGPAATMDYLYNERLIARHGLRDWETTVRHLSEVRCGHVIEIDRDRGAEEALQRELDGVMGELPSRDSWLRFLLQGVPALRERGWTITTEPSFPHRLAPMTGWYADVTAKGRSEWFDLKLGIVVDGQPVNLLPSLVDYLQTTHAEGAPSLLAADHLFVELEDGRYLPVPTDRLRRIAETLVELFDRDALNDLGSLSLPRNQAVRLAELAQDGLAPLRSDDPDLRPDDADLLRRIDEIRDVSTIPPLAAPPGCRATLREYQQQGLAWLQFLRRRRLGGILADDMGLGKTLQILAHLATEKAHGRLGKPVLIVAPVSVIGNWQLEVRRFTPDLTSVILHGAKRKALFSSLHQFDIIITGYPSLLFDGEMLLDREFSTVVLDEAQTIKNPHARVSRAARALRAEHRLCLTGTPMENHLGDLWSLFEFVQPGLLGSEHSFQRHYRTPIEKNANTVRAEALGRRIAPFLLRRTKDAVARELPPKTEIVESIVLNEKQRDLYDGIRLSMHRRVRDAIASQGLGRSRILMIEALLRLRQACCDPRLIESATPVAVTDAAQEPEAPSAKLDWLSTALPELIAAGRRILLFSQFTRMLRLIETVVQELSIPYCLLTGDTHDRPTVIEQFQRGKVPLFLLSLKAGGAGLNLTAADTVIHYDPWWNPAVEMQATDRAHRIGQDKPVFVYKLIAQGTVEEKILKLQADKHALVSQLYTAGQAAPSPLSAGELEALLGP